MTEGAALSLRGKRALVTGAGQRVGQAIAVALGAEGMHVGVHYRESRAGAEETARLITASGGSATLLAADLSSREEARRLVDRAVTELGGLELVVASAASFERVDLADVDDDAWDRSLGLNLASPFALVHRAVPAVAARPCEEDPAAIGLQRATECTVVHLPAGWGPTRSSGPG
jgi:NAD(P)-dependent dehydrogenase (short-subunit alcohol dehydrogenase family)